MVIRFRIAWVILPLLCASSAIAKETIKQREVQARKDCLTGKVESGVNLLVELFTETRDANYVFNQARCYESNDRPDEAIRVFREYLRVAKNADATVKADVERHITECQALLAEQNRKDKPASSPAPQERIPSAAPPASVPASPAGVDVAAQPNDGSTVGSPFYKTWWFWTGTAAVVVAGTITAILLANRSSSPCDGAGLPCREVR